MIGAAMARQHPQGASADAVVDRVRAQKIAENALAGLSDKDRVHFALRLILGACDPQAAGCVSFAARQIGEHASTLMREAFEQGCG